MGTKWVNILNIKDNDLNKTISSLLFKDARNDTFNELILNTIYKKNHIKNAIQEFYSGDVLYILAITASCIEIENETIILLIFHDITDIYELKDARQALKKIQSIKVNSILGIKKEKLSWDNI